MKHVFVAFLIVLTAVSCEESVPPVDFGKPGTILLFHGSESLTTSEIPEPQYRGILIEDLTGVRCNNCPEAAKSAKSVKDDSENNEVVILGLYTEGPKSLTGPHNNVIDMRTEAAQLIGTNIYNFGNLLPGGGVNRRAADGSASLNTTHTIWTNMAETYKDEKTIVNLDVLKTQKDDSTMVFNCFATFTSVQEEQPFLTLLLLENGISHPQTTPNGVDNEYIHDHVVRENITPYNGMPLTVPDGDPIQVGSRIEVEYQVQLPEGLDLSNASLAAFVNYNGEENKEVIHCTEIKLK